MTKIRFMPILMRNDEHDVVKVGSVQYNEQSGNLTFRVNIDTLMGEHKMIGRAIEIGLIESFQMKPIVSELGKEITEDVIVPQPYESIDGVVTLEEADEAEYTDGTTHSDG